MFENKHNGAKKLKKNPTTPLIMASTPQTTIPTFMSHFNHVGNASSGSTVIITRG